MNEDVTTQAAEIGTTNIADGDIKSLGTLVYLLQAVGLFIGITFIAGVIVNYLKRAEVAGTWMESHFRWQIRTFWFALLWLLLGVLLIVTLVGAPVGLGLLATVTVWLIYRIGRGWLRLLDRQPMYL